MLSAMWIIIGLGLYVLIGLVVLASDYRQPKLNQPDYIRNPTFGMIASVILLWPIILYSRVRKL